MGDGAATTSRMGLRHTGGEIVEVQGGHIVRSTGRKDRHSKVCTSRGPRDRRVRLSAHTAIQFYDVQDRLGYDRPSKAVDWLITKAKSAIDELAELPPWKPTTTASARAKRSNNDQEDENLVSTIDNEKPYLVSDARGREVEEIPINNNSGSLQPSFFPVGASGETSSSSLQFQNYPPDFLSRTGSHSQDLRLSLQSFPEPILLHHQDHQQAPAEAPAHQSGPVLFSGTSSLAGFDGSSAGWEQHHNNHQQQHHAEMGRFQRLIAWNSSGGGADTGSAGGIGGFLFGNQLPPSSVSSSAYGGQNSQFYSERGPLQSNNMPFVRAWIDQPIPTIHHQIPQNFHHHHQAALSSGFHIPARFQGEEEEHDSIHNKLSSASSDSHH